MIKQLETAISKLSELSDAEQENIARMIMTTIENKQSSPSAWDTLKEMAGSIEAPEDWSQQHAHYLYGTPKQNQEHE
ncbi:hypothetical protein A5482_015035 (plasmid) [Cyanobacterium sp. IPPAS B-1200]|uniref:hypothetical protein n=1 Tax=Cyanobacterium sp. IPPAS B-1200 TaxID=1562720 RepID=UPI0008527E9F|nr:hypothetical protein [Cyanobacterium sp. IPPAS B-1200]OEJ77390.1 hypothetical protein A5482_15490 [Cyanobacterium sp. IPPAS B-1200]OEJ77716.1 hypothetical protein A5482_15230 [Cyanobacterium sp. IPPAS B-1200]